MLRGSALVRQGSRRYFLPVTAAKWWDKLDPRVNGVFKGGGAKGLLYAGAISAVADHGLWFRAVAGSSAGAITATLIAAGLSPETLDACVPQALGNVRKMWLGDLVASPLVRTDRLRVWLEHRLREQCDVLGHPVPDGTLVTFKQLLAASNIELYVVAVDVARRQPIVFSAATTPGLAVSPAVIASSAIPIAFWPGRLKVKYDNGADGVHRLSDGGVWANYPAFVFKDRNFRAYHGLPDVPEETLTIGFTLDRPDPVPPGEPVELVTHRRGAGRDQGVWSAYGVIGRAPVRLYLFTLIPILIALEAAYAFHAAGLVFLKDYATRDGVPQIVTSIAAWIDGFTSESTMVWLIYLGIVLMIGLAVVATVIGATLIDAGVPVIRTLMAVGTNVPYWVGHADGDHVVRLEVPPGLETTSFRLDSDAVRGWVEGARASADTQLNDILG